MLRRFLDFRFQRLAEIAQHLHSSRHVFRWVVHVRVVSGSTGGAADSLGEFFYLLKLLEIISVKRVLLLEGGSQGGSQRAKIAGAYEVLLVFLLLILNRAFSLHFLFDAIECWAGIAVFIVID